VCKRRDCWLTRYTKEEHKEVRKGFKKCVHQYLINNNIDDDFNKDIIAIIVNILTPTALPTNSNFFYNNYGIEYFITLNRPIPIKTAKNIVTFINNNTFAYSLTSNIEASTKPSTARHGNDGNRSSNNKDKNTTYFYNNNPPDFTVDINFLNCHFNDNK
jgi:hypothetical protein